MEKKKLNKFNIILLIIIVALFLVPSIIHLAKDHHSSMRLVLEKKVIDAAQTCHIESNCESNIITLDELISKGYMQKLYDPITKELINPDSYVDLDSKEFKIVE